MEFLVPPPFLCALLNLNEEEVKRNQAAKLMKGQLNESVGDHPSSEQDVLDDMSSGQPSSLGPGFQGPFQTYKDILPLSSPQAITDSASDASHLHRTCNLDLHATCTSTFSDQPLGSELPTLSCGGRLPSSAVHLMWLCRGPWHGIDVCLI